MGILFASVLANIKLMNKSDVIVLKVLLSVRCTNSDYLEDYPVITKMDNPEVIKNFIEHAFKEGKVIRYRDIPDNPTDVFKPYNKKKQVASIVLKDFQKPYKKRAVHPKDIEKKIEEVIASTELMPSQTRSEKSPKKVASISAITEAPLKKKRLRKAI